MYTDDLYGFLESDLDQVSSTLELLLQIQFELHESLYVDEYNLYNYPKPSRGELKLYHNLDPFDDLPAELEFAEFPLLFSVWQAPDPFALESIILNKIPGARLLRRNIRE